MSDDAEETEDRDGSNAVLYYYRARYYSPKLGRFLQTDPIGNKDDFNLYAYTYNDALNKMDPAGTGECPNGGANCPILGTAQTSGTAGHPEAGNIDADRMAKSGDYKRVHLNQKLSTIAGDPAVGGQQPDVAGVRKDTGGIDTIEHPSNSQTAAQMDAKGAEMQRKLESIGKAGKHETKSISSVLKGKMKGGGTVGVIITAGLAAAAIAENPTKEGVNETFKETLGETLCGFMGGCAPAE